MSKRGRKHLGNRIEIREDHAVIFSSKGDEFLVDIEDLPCLAVSTWSPLKSKKGNPYAIGYFSDRATNKKLLMHRFLMGEPDGFDVDHVNRNPSDNRRANLRIASRSENLWNAGPQEGKPAKGTFFCKGPKRWKATIRANGKQHHLGYFSNIEDAKQAYNKAARELHGEFAYQNP